MRVLALFSLLLAGPALAQHPLGVIAGRIVGVDSLGMTFPLTDHTVSFRRLDSTRVRTDGGGRFLVTVPAGERTIRFRSGRYTDIEKRVTVAPGDTLFVDLRSRVRGRSSGFVYGREDLSWMERWEVPREMERVVQTLTPETPPSATGRSELWVWANYHLFNPNLFARLIVEGGHVRGESMRYWTLDPYNPTLDARLRRLEAEAQCDTFAISHRYVPRKPLPESHRYCVSETDSGCAPPPSPGLAACRRKLDEEPDWEALLNEIEEHDVWTLWDESALPSPPWITLDGWSLVVVAIQDGSRRTYHYSNPDGQASFHRQHATAIARVLEAAGLVSAPSERF